MFLIEGYEELAFQDLSGRVKPLSIYTLNELRELPDGQGF